MVEEIEEIMEDEEYEELIERLARDMYIYTYEHVHFADNVIRFSSTDYATWKLQSASVRENMNMEEICWRTHEPIWAISNKVDKMALMYAMLSRYRQYSICFTGHYFRNSKENSLVFFCPIGSRLLEDLGNRILQDERND